ncbi:MAG: CxxxxCH/CxxCH domain-containing protein [Desulfuromonadales bacterium]
MRYYLIRISAAAALLFALAACSSGNSSDAPVVDSGGEHPAGWSRTHKSWITVNKSMLPDSCTGCHGNDLSGGISRVSCMSSTAISGMRCHAANPAVSSSGCTSCHGYPPAGDAHSKHLALTGVTCDVCHNGAGTGTALHANGTTDLILASGFKAKTGTFSYNPASGSCSAVMCHGGLPTPGWSSGSISGCTACHGYPPAGNAHSKHLALAGVTCNVCHYGAGANTVLHADGTVEVILASGFKAKIGTFSFNPASGSCSAVLCHGGLPTPSWSNGSISGCTACHGYPPPGNAHSKHLALPGVACDSCHNGAGANTALHANGTVDISLASNFKAKTGTFSYNPASGSCSAVVCHGGLPTPSWSSGSISGCTACHGYPPVSNAHSKHLALANVACDTCHNGAGAGTVLHENGTVNVILASNFKSKSGTFSYDPASGSCSAVMCHGGLPTPNWSGGSTAGCTACHGYPPAGNVHSKHLALPGVTCNSCHNGAGANTALHINGTVDVSIASAFKAKTGTISYSPAIGTCSAIICHGGQTTPGWSTGSITISTDCLKCHEQGTASQTPQYNSFFSGKTTILATTPVNLHQLHVLLKVSSTTPSIFCTDCHNTATLADKHFAGLATPAFEATAAGTIGGGNSRITGYVPFTSAVPSGNCTSTCHTGTRNWINNP